MGAGVGSQGCIDNEPSPHCTAIENAQAELRREVAVWEERKRELDFLEKGGNPLDFNFGGTASSFQSPLSTDPLAEQFLPSEGEGTDVVDALVKSDYIEGITVHGLHSKRPLDPVNILSNKAEVAVLSNDNAQPNLDSKGLTLPTRITSSISDHRQNVAVKKSVEVSGGIRAGLKGQYARRNRSRINRFSNGNNERDSEKVIVEDASPISSSGVKVSYEYSTEGREVTKEIEIQADTCYDVVVFCNSQTVPGARHEGEKETAIVSCSENDTIVDVSEPVLEKAACKADAPDGLDKHSNVLKAMSHAHMKMALAADAHVEVDSIDGEKTAILDASELDLELKKDVSYIDSKENLASKTREQNVSDLIRVDQKEDVLHSTNSEVIKTTPDKQSVEHPKSSGDQNAIRNSGSYDNTNLPLLSRKILDTTPVAALTSRSMDLASEVAVLDDKSDPVASFHTVEASGNQLGNSVRAIGEVKAELKEGTSEGTVGCSLPGLKIGNLMNGAITGLGNTSLEVSKEGNRSPQIVRPSTHGGTAWPHSRALGTFGAPNSKFPSMVLPWEKEKDPSVVAETERHKANLSAAAKKAHEDFILEEAEVIKSGRKWSAELASSKAYPEPSNRKSHWDFLLEEMAWMANDFMQERLWKTAAAAQVARWIAEEFHETELCCRQRKIARRLANAVTKYWQLVEAQSCRDKLKVTQFEDGDALEISLKSKGRSVEAVVEEGNSAIGKIPQSAVSKSKSRSGRVLPVQEYAMRFVKGSFSFQPVAHAEAPPTPERVSEGGIFDSWEYQFPEESLHHTVPYGAMESYRVSVESEYEQMLQQHAMAMAEAELQAAAETTEDSVGVSDFSLSGFVNENLSFTGLSSSNRGFGANDDDAQLQYVPESFDGVKGAIHKKKRKKIFKTDPSKVVENKSSSGFFHHTLAAPNAEPVGALPSFHVTGKRTVPGLIDSSNFSAGSIPTKRMRTSAVAARQRAAGVTGGGLGVTSSSSGLLPRSDVSSGETYSQQDDLNTLLDGSTSGRGMDVDSAAALGKGAMTEGVDSPYKTKKKRKTKHFIGGLSASATSDGGVNMFSFGKKEQVKRRGEQHSQGGMGSLRGLATMTSSSHSTVNNLSSASKLMKQISNHDRSRKNKSIKVPNNQPGFVIPWSSAEDKALIGLVHELGPNWELLSDILSSGSQLKGIYRKPRECRERHKLLMERLSGDGEDSPEDSGSSQPHSSNSGAQMGGPRLALQRMHSPLEEDTLKAHLEWLVQFHQQHRSQMLLNDSQEAKQLVPVHPSHAMVVSQICPSNLTGGILTPLELCEQSLSNGDLAPHAFSMQPENGNALGMNNMLASGSGIHPGSAGISLLHGPNGLPLGPNLMSSSAVNAAVARDVQRLGASMRPFSTEEQQLRYNRIVAGRLQSQGVSVTSGLPLMGVANPNDSILPSGNSAGIMSDLNRGMPLSRPGLPGLGAQNISDIVSAGLNNILPSTGVGLPNASAIPPGTVHGPMNTIRRPREGIPSVRSPEEQRQLFLQELRHQAAYGNTQAAAALNNLNSSLSNSMVSSPTQNFTSQPKQHQKQLQQNSSANQQQQQAYFMQFAKEQQQKRLLQQQQPFLTNNASQSTLQSAQCQSISQQHAMPSHSHFLSPPQHQHMLPQQQHVVPSHTQQQTGSVLPLTASTLQQTTQSPSAPSPLNSSTQSPQQQALSQPHPLSHSGQPSQLSMQPKQQQHNQLSKQQQMQQQQMKTMKGIGTVAMPVQGFSAQQAQPSLSSGQPAQLSGQQLPNSLQGQRLLQSQGSGSLGKHLPNISSAIMTGQQNRLPVQACTQVQASTVSQGPTTVVQQQKVFSQHLPAKQSLQHLPSIPPSPSSSSSLQSPVSPPVPPAVQQQQLSPLSQLSASQQQPQVASLPHSLSSQQQQLRRPTQQSQSQQRRPQQRQTGSNANIQISTQLGKNGLQQQGPVTSQISVQSGHMAFQLGSNRNNPLSMGPTSPVSFSSPLASSTVGVNSTQWRTGQSFAPMPSGIYNLSRSNNGAATQISPINCSSGLPAASSNGSSGVVVVSTSLLTHAVTAGGLPQQSTLHVGGAHGQKLGVVSTGNSRAVAASQIGGPQRQQLQQQQSGMQSSHITNTLEMLQVRPPLPASSGVVPCPTLGVPEASASPGSLAFQGNPVAPLNQTVTVSGPTLYTAVQPRQAHSGQPLAIGTQGSTTSVISTAPGTSTVSSGAANVPATVGNVVTMSPQ